MHFREAEKERGVHHEEHEEHEELEGRGSESGRRKGFTRRHGEHGARPAKGSGAELCLEC